MPVPIDRQVLSEVLSGEGNDEIVLGCVLQAGLGQNVARQVALQSGIPKEKTALTVNMVCGSGLRSVSLAAQAIRCGDAELVVAGGTESMSNAPYLLPKARSGYGMGHGDVLDSMVQDGLWDVFNGGAIALGHPIGASGSRILVTLLHEMRRRSVRKGLAALCIGGGMGIAMCLERE